MKLTYIINLAVVSLLISNVVNAQHGQYPILPNGNGFGIISTDGDTIFIQGGLDNAGNFENVINGDTVMAGETIPGQRAHPNRIYVLEGGQGANSLYFQNNAINVTDPSCTLNIIGYPLGVQRPVILKQEFQYPLGSNQLNCNLTIKNIQYESEDLSNAYPASTLEWNIIGNNHTLDAENNLFEFCGTALFGMQNVPQGAKAFLRGNYFRDYFNGSQLWGGSALFAEVPIDTLIFENNTSTGSGLLVHSQNSLTAYALINHNTIINNIKYPFLDAYYLECYFTNNLIINNNLAGDDSTNFIAVYGAKTKNITAFQNEYPDGLRVGVIGVDTIYCKHVQTKYQIDTTVIVEYPNDTTINGNDTTIAKDTVIVINNQNLVGLPHIKFYAADNYLVQDTTKVLVNYFKGIPYDSITGSAASYLNWAGKTGPFPVINFPETFINSRGIALATNYKNIVISSDHPNSDYTLTANDLGMTTPTMDTVKADYWIQFNRNEYNVPGVASPKAYAGNPSPAARFAFGDFNPSTIPGPGGLEVNYYSSTGGIVNFTDLKENFALNSSIVSDIDNLPIGSLIWLSTPVILNEPTDTALIKNAFRAEAATKTTITSVDNATGTTSYTISNNPNPFSGTTTIVFTLPNPTHVKLTVYDLSGNIVSSILNEDISNGLHSVQYTTPEGLASGIYFYMLTTNETVVTGKMIYQK